MYTSRRSPGLIPLSALSVRIVFTRENMLSIFISASMLRLNGATGQALFARIFPFVTYP